MKPTVPADGGSPAALADEAPLRPPRRPYFNGVYVLAGEVRRSVSVVVFAADSPRPPPVRIEVYAGLGARELGEIPVPGPLDVIVVRIAGLRDIGGGNAALRRSDAGAIASWVQRVVSRMPRTGELEIVEIGADGTAMPTSGGAEFLAPFRSIR